MEKTAEAGKFIGLVLPTWGNIIVLLGMLWGVYTWWRSQKGNQKLRKEEIAWRRAEFLFKQGAIFDGDNEISEAVKMVTENDSTLTIENLLDADSAISKEVRGDGMHKLDKLLNLLERLSSANAEGVLSNGDVRCFEWYFHRISNNLRLKEYCEDHYPDILTAAKRIQSDT